MQRVVVHVKDLDLEAEAIGGLKHRKGPQMSCSKNAGFSLPNQCFHIYSM
jgi:hypothetical protein